MGSLHLVAQLVKEKENSEFKPVKLFLKIDLVLYSGHGREDIYIYIYIYIYKHTQI